MIETISRPELGEDILGLQPRDKAAMLVVNKTECFHEEFTWKWSLVPWGAKRFCSWPSTWPPWRHVQTSNKPFPRSPWPLYQNDVKCSAFDEEMIFHSHANKTYFHKKGCALGLILKERVFGTRKWPIPESYLCPLPSPNLHFPLSLALAHFFLFEKSLRRVIIRIISSFQSHPYSISCNYSNELTCVSKWTVTLQAD